MKISSILEGRLWVNYWKKCIKPYNIWKVHYEVFDLQSKWNCYFEVGGNDVIMKLAEIGTFYTKIVILRKLTIQIWRSIALFSSSSLSGSIKSTHFWIWGCSKMHFVRVLPYRYCDRTYDVTAQNLRLQFFLFLCFFTTIRS